MAKQAIHPAKYYRDYLSHNIRPDGRGFMKFRPIAVNLGSISTADGSAIIKLGNTTVVCGIKAEVAKPKADDPDCGYLIPNVELTPLCSSRFRPGPPSDLAQVTTRVVADIIQDSNCINLKDLCIVKDKLVWVLYCDLICLDYDGAIIDACVIALVSALNSVVLPTIQYLPDLDQISINENSRVGLQIHAMPISTTFVMFEDGQLLADPTIEEEGLCSGTITVVVCSDKVSSVLKPGGIPLSQEQLHLCMTETKKQSKFICDLIQTALGATSEK